MKEISLGVHCKQDPRRGNDHKPTLHLGSDLRSQILWKTRIARMKHIFPMIVILLLIALNVEFATSLVVLFLVILAMTAPEQPWR